MGEKRPAVGSEEDRADLDLSGLSGLVSRHRHRIRRGSQRLPRFLRLILSPPDAVIGVGVDLICNIASYMNPGNDLMNLCVSVGPADAARIRTEYLRDNEQYVTASLMQVEGYPWTSPNTIGMFSVGTCIYSTSAVIIFRHGCK